VADTPDLETALVSLCAAIGIDLIDVELTGSTLSITIERGDGLDLDTVAETNRMISAFLDEHESLAPTGRYELEVGTPGLERRLRRREHFARAIGETVSVRTLPGTEGARRIEGVLDSVDDDGFVLSPDSGSPRRFGFAEVERAKTVFDWQQALRAPSRGERDEIDDERAEKTTTKPREARR
jgi:ribosome maturation factor RimP